MTTATEPRELTLESHPEIATWMQKVAELAAKRDELRSQIGRLRKPAAESQSAELQQLIDQQSKLIRKRNAARQEASQQLHLLNEQQRMTGFRGEKTQARYDAAREQESDLIAQLHAMRDSIANAERRDKRERSVSRETRELLGIESDGASTAELEERRKSELGAAETELQRIEIAIAEGKRRSETHLADAKAALRPRLEAEYAQRLEAAIDAAKDLQHALEGIDAFVRQPVGFALKIQDLLGSRHVPAQFARLAVYGDPRAGVTFGVSAVGAIDKWF